VSRTNTIESTEALLGVRTCVGPKHQVLGGGPDLPTERGNFFLGGGRGSSPLEGIVIVSYDELILARLSIMG